MSLKPTDEFIFLGNIVKLTHVIKMHHSMFSMENGLHIIYTFFRKKHKRSTYFKLNETLTDYVISVKSAVLI